LGLHTDIDRVLHLPLRYEDETQLTAIAQLRQGELAQVEGVVSECRLEPRYRRQLLVTLDDGSGPLLLRFLNFYASQQKAWAAGVRLRVRGEARVSLMGREMVHPTVRIVQPGQPLPDTLTPIYPTTAALPQTYLRKTIVSALGRAALHEVLPEGVIPEGWPSFRQAVNAIHHPAMAELHALQNQTHPAWTRLKFDELLAQQISQWQARQARTLIHAPALHTHADGLQDRLKAQLPFALTQAQERVVQEITADLARGTSMHRLLQGDVGSGKTVVAALAAAVCIDQGWQCALMAPTEILAEQHFRKLVTWLEPLGVRVAWLTGSLKSKAKQAQLAMVASGEAALVVGTHAVIQAQVKFAKLGLALIDEQHRFGVAQRLQLREKLQTQDLEPHVLMMSATPIPRTLAMTYLADLDVSTIDELPPGRTPIITKVVAHHRRDEVMCHIRDEAGKGRQVYWVCPLIDEAEDAESAEPTDSPASKRPPLDLSNVIETHETLCQVLQGQGVGLLHGRMRAADKQAVMAQFSSGELSVLVATTVIEVGVDVPNASLMVIEHAERFGLSQLHQLRGRVGRGDVASVCVLLYSTPLSDSGKARLKAMAETNDGFEIARRDLQIRGPGEFMGARQSGAALLRFADLMEDQALVERAQRMAEQLLLAHPDAAQAHMARWLGEKAQYFKA
jgi:ATP-dependent DNA helicase RecG